MPTSNGDIRTRLVDVRGRYLAARALAEWRRQSPAARRAVVAELELALHDERPERAACIAAIDVLDVAATPDGLQIPDSLLSDLEWLVAELDARVGTEA